MKQAIEALRAEANNHRRAVDNHQRNGIALAKQAAEAFAKSDAAKLAAEEFNKAANELASKVGGSFVIFADSVDLIDPAPKENRFYRSTDTTNGAAAVDTRQ